VKLQEAVTVDHPRDDRAHIVGDAMILGDPRDRLGILRRICRRQVVA
jgi:hypothetical protein